MCYPSCFSFTVLFWVSGFDIIYALQDEEFDKANQLHSIPAAVGKKNALRISEVLHAVSAACVIYAEFTVDLVCGIRIGVVCFFRNACLPAFYSKTYRSS